MPTLNTFWMQHAWLVPLLPLFSFALLGMIIRPYLPRAAGVIATLAVLSTFVISMGMTVEYLRAGTEGAIVPCEVEWLRYQEHLSVKAGVLIDSLSLLLLLVVTSVSSLVYIYSIAYMHDDEGRARFFTYLNLFTASMLGLVVAPNILQTFVCWELVGVSSFLLIGFYYTKPEAVAASKKAFIVTRFADLGFLLAALVIAACGYNEFQTAPVAGLEPFDFRYLTSPQFLQAFAGLASFIPGVSLCTLTLLLLFMGAAGKSAMFPLHIWLPDAMEGPTPVSALIHAATMVVAGVYLVARTFSLYTLSPVALGFIAAVGTFTCLFAALIGCVQNDLKRVLAFSTLSQLGYMMLALGVASTAHPLGYSASMFHLFTHAFFKALLFLCAGAAIHAVHTNNIWEMGGLRRKMPVTHLSFLIAMLAIAGVPPLAGFWSKDEILSAALHSGHYVVFGVALRVAGLTAFYMSRLYFVCFSGEARSNSAGHAHEAPVLMLVPLVVLSVFSIGAGFIPVPEHIYLAALPTAHAGSQLIPILGTIVALVGIFAGWFFYVKNTDLRDNLVERISYLYILLRRKFFIDEAYLWATKRVVFACIARPAAWFDRYVVDSTMNLIGWSTRCTGRVMSYAQTGQLQGYGVWIVVGVLLLFICLV